MSHRWGHYRRYQAHPLPSARAEAIVFVVALLAGLFLIVGLLGGGTPTQAAEPTGSIGTPLVSFKPHHGHQIPLPAVTMPPTDTAS